MQIKVMSDSDCVARRAAAVIAEHARAAFAARGRFSMAISGGYTPRAMLRMLGREEVPWGPGPQNTGVMGSSLGGVVSFYMTWQWPNVFGNAGCLSSTFTHKDDLVERVLQEPRRDVRFYLDSGWPGDNYEVGLAMALALAERGYRYGHDFLYFAFPNAKHSENDWGQRLHVPFQFFAGRPAVVSRSKEIAVAAQK